MEMKYVKMTTQHPTSNAKPSFRASIRLKFRTTAFSYPIFRASPPLVEASAERKHRW
ncbi:hypothetical protein MUK42_36623 [Musa troglodytarum]|uniref:Uncharacterized protein n=1 Tax=Musa troglodytarum TaxID=320322 RepID=A0A9E7JBD3_9LILI|nr:hypothetical protein MUK42_36623 [Musa troglodytarum]